MLKRIFKIALMLAAFASTAASCEKRHSTDTLQPISRVPQCAFADPVSMTSLGVSYVTADYYVTHREWPLTKAQLQGDLMKLVDADRAQISAEEMKEDSEFFDRFTLLDLRTNNEDLVMHYRFSIDGKKVDQKVILEPAQTVDEILQAAKENKNPDKNYN